MPTPKRGLIKNSKSPKTIGTNIKKLEKYENMPYEQALAISLGLQKGAKKKKKK
jgi:hypothetical protein